MKGGKARHCQHKARPGGNHAASKGRAQIAKPGQAYEQSHRTVKAEPPRKQARAKAHCGAQSRAQRHHKAHIRSSTAKGQRHECQHNRNGIEKAVNQNVVQIQHDKASAGYHG